MELKQILGHGRSHIHEGPDTKRPRFTRRKNLVNSQGCWLPIPRDIVHEEFVLKIEPDKKSSWLLQISTTNTNGRISTKAFLHLRSHHGTIEKPML